MDEPEYPVEEWLPLIFRGDPDAETRFHIVTDIISHPAELPTREELHYSLTATGERSADAVDEQLDVLVDAGVVTAVDGDEYTFWGLTDRAKQFVVDSRQYRGSDVLTGLYHALERPDDIETAYRAERPDHPPATDEYEERDFPDSDAWDAGREATYRTLYLSYERVGERRFEAKLVEGDDGRVLDVVANIEVGEVRDPTEDYREMEYTEKRGAVADDEAYTIKVEEGYGTYCFQPSRNGEDWYEMVDRSLCIFAE